MIQLLINEHEGVGLTLDIQMICGMYTKILKRTTRLKNVKY